MSLSQRVPLANRGATRAVRLLTVVDALRSRRRGIRQHDLVELLGVSRQSLHGYLIDLEEAGFPLVRTKRSGEVWLTLGGDWLTAPSTAELFALVVAHQALRGLPNSPAEQWLAPRLQKLTAVPRVTIDAVAVEGVDAAAVVRAAVEGKRLRLDYRGLKDDVARPRLVEPIEMRFSQRAWYLFCLDVECREPRTFKLARITAARVLDEPCSLLGNIDAELEHEHAVGVWTSKDEYDVAVRLHPPQARFAREYPLTTTQTLTTEGDCVVVRARVSGLEEVTRWVLRWGGDAEVLEPPALVERLRSELERMQARLR